MISTIWISISLLLASLAQGLPADPLPDLQEFLKGVRAHLASDRLLQSQYTYTLKETEIQLDKKGNPRKTDVAVYEVYPSLEEGGAYRRCISNNGMPVPPEELEKQDRAHEKQMAKRMAKRRAKLDKGGADEVAHRVREEADARRRERAIIDELMQLYRITMVGRERINGVSTIALDFQPRREHKPRLRETKILARVGGRAWFCERDYELVRVEAEVINTLSFGMGILARVNRGTRMVFVRRRINDEVWLPAEAQITVNARLLLLKGMRVRVESEFSDYRKFQVESSVKYGSPAATTETPEQ